MTNGRVDLMNPKTEDLFAMYDRIPCDKNVTDFRGSLKGNWSENALATMFFSAANVQIIQNGIRAGVHTMSDGSIVVPNQCNNTLQIIMRSMYLQHAKNSSTDITEQIRHLNQLVLDYCVKSVYNGAVSYNKYLHDVSTIEVPNLMPVKSTYKTDNKALKMPEFM